MTTCSPERGQVMLRNVVTLGFCQAPDGATHGRVRYLQEAVFLI